MNDASSESSRIDPECYARDLEPTLRRKSKSEQIAFAYDCASSVAHFFQKFDRTEWSIERAVRTVKLWRDGKCTIDAVKAFVPKVSAAFERAVNAYDDADLNNNVYNASPSGVAAFQALEAARSVQDLLQAVIYSNETVRDETTDPLGYCADAAAGALAATIFSESELKRQANLLDANQ